MLNTISYPWLMLGDCLERMKEIPDCSIDLILCDLPYGITACKWDVALPIDSLWSHYWRVLKEDAAVLLFGVEPFSSYLRMSQIKNFKYDWIIEKSRATNFVHANCQPLRAHEVVSVFSKSPAAQNHKKRMKYYPQFSKGDPYVRKNGNQRPKTISGGNVKNIFKNDGIRHPRSVLYYSWDSDGKKNRYHPTQKPVALLEYLVKTYTNPDDIVLDNTMGSGSTGVACMNTYRRFVGIEKDEIFFEIAEKRIKQAKET